MDKKNSSQKTEKLFYFLYDYNYLSSQDFEKKYPEYDKWMLENKGSDVIDYIRENLL